MRYRRQKMRVTKKKNMKVRRTLKKKKKKKKVNRKMGSTSLYLVRKSFQAATLTLSILSSFKEPYSSMHKNKNRWQKWTFSINSKTISFKMSAHIQFLNRSNNLPLSILVTSVTWKKHLLRQRKSHLKKISLPISSVLFPLNNKWIQKQKVSAWVRTSWLLWIQSQICRLPRFRNRIVLLLSRCQGSLTRNSYRIR